MKKDKLEQFIQNNRVGFDSAVPSKAIWEKLEQQLPPQEAKRFTIRRFLSIAASVLVLVGMGIAIGWQLAPKQAAINGLAVISPEYGEVEQYYTNKVNYKLAQLAAYSSSSDSLLQKDLNELDNWLLILQKDLQEVPKGKKEPVINAIINNYKKKLLILETVLETIEEQEVINNEEAIITI